MSKITIKGHVKITVTNVVTGEIEVQEQENLITSAGVAHLINCLLNEVDDPISKIGFGEDGTAPAAGNTGITDGLIKNIAIVDDQVAGSIVCVWSLETFEGNGIVIAEYGLFTTDEILFARRTRPPFTKTDAIRIDGTWTITFV
jgi:hypothetical protein